MIDLSEVLNAGVRMRHAQRGEHHSHVSPSKLKVTIPGEGCPLEAWALHKHYARRELSSGQCFMFENAHSMHQRVCEMIKSVGRLSPWKVVAIEKPCAYEVDGVAVYGTADLVIEDNEGNMLVADVKTRRGNAFSHLFEARPGDVLQVQAYMRALDANRGGVIYVDREGQNASRWFVVERDDAAVGDATRKLRDILKDIPKPLKPLPIRKELKGPDSLWIKRPWKMDYCSLEECLCIAANPGIPTNKTKVGTFPDDADAPKMLDGFEHFAHLFQGEEE